MTKQTTPKQSDMSAEDLTGRRFGRWSVVSKSGIVNKLRLWLCICECGTQKEVSEKSLKNGDSQSCGCRRGERWITNGKTVIGYGVCRTEEDKRMRAVWAGMIVRCTNPKHRRWNYYGGRGISVCDRWLNFENFREDMGYRPSPQHQLDRIDCNGNYEPGNCRWVTRKENHRNRRNNKLLTCNGVTQTLVAWADQLGTSGQTISRRIERGWDVCAAVTTPPGNTGGRARKQKRERINNGRIA